MNTCANRSKTRLDRVLANSCATATLCAAAFSASQNTFADESGWTVPRTSDGQPDLQGYWTNNTVIPLERPAELGDKALFTEEEVAAFMQQRLVPEETESGTAADVHYQLTDFGLDHSQNTVNVNLRTSLITDPADGRMPPPLPAAAASAKERTDYLRAHAFDSAQDRSLGERCILWSHQGPPIIPVGYNSNVRILQSPGYVVIQTEMLQDARMVPLDGRPHLSSGVRQWLGDSRGRWEGDTLVVETANYTGETGIRGSVPNLRLSTDARVIERFERTGEDTIRYRFTVEDPNTWGRPWSAEYPMTRIEGPMFEYACHEGNYGIVNTLNGARAEERAAAEAAKRNAE
jgi:hypothetical protein